MQLLLLWPSFVKPTIYFVQCELAVSITSVLFTFTQVDLNFLRNMRFAKKHNKDGLKKLRKAAMETKLEL